jgi:hypothetical protein
MMDNPERLYHFTTAKYALDYIRNRHLKIAQFDDLNDPFELKSVNLCDRVLAQTFDGIQEKDFEGFKATIARRFGVLCFSEEKTDALQWRTTQTVIRESVWASMSLEAKESLGGSSMR